MIFKTIRWRVVPKRWCQDVSPADRQEENLVLTKRTSREARSNELISERLWPVATISIGNPERLVISSYGADIYRLW